MTKYRVFYGQGTQANVVVRTEIIADRSPGPAKTIPKPPSQSGHSRGYSTAIELIKMGIADWSVIEEAVIKKYQAETERTEKRILRACKQLKITLIKEGLIIN